MRHSAFSCAALLTCGLLVFGRPRSTPSEKRDLNPLTDTPYSNIDSTLSNLGAPGSSLGTTPDAPLPFTTLNVPTAPDAVLGTSWTSAQLPKVPLQDTYRETAFMDPNVPHLSPASQQVTQVGATTPSPLDTSDNTGNPNVLRIELSGDALPTNFIPALPKDFHEILETMKSNEPPFTYCIFTLSQKRRSFELKKSGTNDGSFPQALLDAELGFAIHLILIDNKYRGLLVLTNVQHMCEAKQPDGRWGEVSECSDDRRRLLNSILYNTWFPAIEQVFDESLVRRGNEITIYCHREDKDWSSPDIDNAVATETCP